MNYDVLLVHAAVFTVGALFSYLILFLTLYRKVKKATIKREFNDKLRQAELVRKVEFFENKLKITTELYNELSSKYDSLEIAHNKRYEENMYLVDKTIKLEVQNAASEVHITYLEALLHKSRITFIGRHTSELLLGDDSNEY